MSSTADLLLVGGTVVTMNENYEIYTDGAVAIKDNSLLAVGDAAEITRVYDAVETIDCQDKVIIPGMVNCPYTYSNDSISWPK